MSSAAPPSSSAPPPQSGVQDATSVPARQYSHTHPLACTFNAQQLPAPASCSESDGGSAKCRHDGNDGASHACTTEGHDEIARPSSAPPEREHARVRSHPAPPAIDKCRSDCRQFPHGWLIRVVWRAGLTLVFSWATSLGRSLQLRSVDSSSRSVRYLSVTSRSLNFALTCLCDHPLPFQPLGAYGPERHKGYGSAFLFEHSVKVSGGLWTPGSSYLKTHALPQRPASR